MRRRLVVTLSVAAVILTASAGAATDPLQKRAQDVRAAIPSAEGYFADHGTYAGMTLAKLRRYDRSLRKVAVRRATRKRYCIQSTLKPLVHYDGPAGPMRKSRCGVRGAEVPRPGSSPAPPATTPEQRLRYAVPAIEAYNADHGGYEGMTVEALRSYDAGITDITVAWATRDAYCIESGEGSETYHRLGPREAPAPGSCPAPPG